MAHGVLSSFDLGHLPATRAHQGRRRWRVLAVLAAMVTTTPAASVALTDEEMWAESAEWW